MSDFDSRNDPEQFVLLHLVEMARGDGRPHAWLMSQKQLDELPVDEVYLSNFAGQVHLMGFPVFLVPEAKAITLARGA